MVSRDKSLISRPIKIIPDNYIFSHVFRFTLHFHLHVACLVPFKVSLQRTAKKFFLFYHAAAKKFLRFLLADAKRSSCACIIFGLFCNQNIHVAKVCEGRSLSVHLPLRNPATVQSGYYESFGLL